MRYQRRLLIRQGLAIAALLGVMAQSGCSKAALDTPTNTIEALPICQELARTLGPSVGTISASGTTNALDERKSLTVRGQPVPWWLSNMEGDEQLAFCAFTNSKGKLNQFITDGSGNYSRQADFERPPVEASLSPG